MHARLKREQAERANGAAREALIAAETEELEATAPLAKPLLADVAKGVSGRSRSRVVAIAGEVLTVSDGGRDYPGEYRITPMPVELAARSGVTTEPSSGGISMPVTGLPRNVAPLSSSSADVTCHEPSGVPSVASCGGSFACVPSEGCVGPSNVAAAAPGGRRRSWSAGAAVHPPHPLGDLLLDPAVVLLHERAEVLAEQLGLRHAVAGAHHPPPCGPGRRPPAPGR
jgi:hypothetical protein